MTVSCREAVTVASGHGGGAPSAGPRNVADSRDVERRRDTTRGGGRAAAAALGLPATTATSRVRGGGGASGA
jgi:hypothetical protein